MPTQGGSLRWIIEADDSQFNQTLDNVEQRAETTVKVLKRNDLGNSFWSSLGKGAKESSVAMGQLASSVASVGWTVFNVGATSAVTALTSLVRKGVQATDFLETSRVAMAGLTGSIASGNKAMSIAANYWQNNPFQRIDVTNATKQLVQFGRNTSQLSGDLEILGNVSLSSGINIAELARYYARVSASGRAMTMDLEMMSDRGVPIYRELAKQLNTTTQGVRDLASAGKIGFEEFRKAMESAVNPEAMEAYENTLARQVDRFKGSIQQLAGAIAGYRVENNQLIISEQGLEKAWTRFLKQLATSLRSDKLKSALASIGEMLAKILDKVTAVLPTIIDKFAGIIDFLSKNKALLVGISGVALTFVGSLASKLPGIGGILGKILEPVKGLAANFMTLFKANPLLAVFIGLMTGGLVAAFKNSENFRNSIKKLFTSLGTIVQKLIPIFQTFVNIFVELVSSDAVVGILETVANVLATVAEALSQIPIEVLTSLVTTILMFKLLDTKPIVGYAVALMGLITILKKIGPNIFESIKKTFENIGKAIYNAGHNLMIGLQNGINEGAKKVFEFVRKVAQTIIKTFQKVLGIHSPSTVMEEQGEYITLGLANGIDSGSSVVQKAMDNLATDILKSIEKVVSNKVDFGLLDYNGQYKEWKKISKMFTVGSQQYETAIEKMEEARKQANLQILSLQRNYNDTLDSTIEKISKMYSLFDKVDTSGGKSATDIISDLDQQVAAIQNFASTKEAINNLDLDKALIDELQSMGIDASQELATIAQMTSEQLAQLNELWLKKQEESNRAGIAEVKNLKEKTLDEVAKIKDGIDGETVSLADAGGRLVESISEGVYGAMPTLEEAFSQMGDYIAKAAKEVGKGSGGEAGNNDIADSVSDSLKEAEDKIKGTAEELGKNLMKYVGVGLVGGVALKLVSNGLINFFKNKVFSKGAADSIANVLLKSGVGSNSEAISKAAAGTSSITKSVNQISGNTASMSSGMSKVSSVMSLIIKGAFAVIAIAAAIAAMAASLKFTHEMMKDVDLLELLAQMGVLALILGVVAAIMGVIGNFAVFVGLGAIVTAVLAGALYLAALALRETGLIAPLIDYKAIIEFEGGLAIISGILALIAGFAVFGAVGAIAEAIIGGGLLLAAMSLAEASKYTSQIDLAAIVALEGILAVVDIILGVVAAFAVFGAVASIANTIIAGGLLVTAIALQETSKRVGDIDSDAIFQLVGILAGVDTALAIISGFAVFGAVASVANTIITGGLLVTALGLVVTGETSKQIDSGAITKLVGVLGIVDSALAILSGFAVLGAISSIVNTVIVGGLLVAAVGLVAAGELGKDINLRGIEKINSAIAETDAILALIMPMSAMAAVSSILNDVIVGGVCFAAEKLLIASELAKGLTKGGLDKLQWMLEQIASWGTGDLFNNLKNVINSALLSDIANHVHGIISKMSGLKPINQKIVESLKLNVEELSKMKIEGSGLFENKGGAAEELEKIVGHVANIANLLGNAKDVNYDKTARLVDAIKLFDRIDDKAKDGIKRLKDLGDSLGNLDWIKKIFSDVPEDIWARAERMVSSIKLFDRIDENARNGALRLKEMGDALGNLDWIKHIFGDVPEDLPQRADNLVEAIKKLSAIKLSKEDVVAALASVNDLLNQIKQTIQNSYGSMKEVGATLGDRIISGLDTKKAEIGVAGERLQGALWGAIEKKLADEYWQGRALANKLKEGIESVSFYSVGENAVQGFINGAKSKDVKSVGWQIADKFLKGLKERGKEGSPWKTTFESGAWAGLGLAEGIASSEALVVGEAYSLADQVIDALSMDDVSVSPTFNPSVGGSVPLMDTEDGYYGGKRPVEINQTNNNYTNYSMQALNRDLAWEISKI